MFRIKICGVKTLRDTLEAMNAGADAIGLNFYAQSPRGTNQKDSEFICSSFQQMRQMWGGHELTFVGVFVNHPVDEISSLCGRRIRSVQLHGDEDPTFMAGLKQLETSDAQGPWTFIRVRRFDERGVAGIADDLAQCQQAGRRPDAVLVDAGRPGQYGGTGHTLPWQELADHRRWLGDTPLILAGGLTPDNVAEAIRVVRPHGVDVASGVESAPGVKDPAKVRDFIAAAREAFAALKE